ncbi:hypothetical protein Taro_002155 [Colocasia esculenta]|uniref:Fe2OG dioxygenase domain-containing protein n=1 Tax=Colocasia esculenta TaxID=4460 RepID=A0A843TK72_COLES|nr:hypothetical protein [Colocasia esculenta]
MGERWSKKKERELGGVLESNPRAGVPQARGRRWFCPLRQASAVGAGCRVGGHASGESRRVGHRAHRGGAIGVEAKRWCRRSSPDLRESKRERASTVASEDGQTASEDSSGVLDSIEQKIARATLIPKEHGEAFNVLRYEIGQRYASHYDAFNPSEYGPQKSQRSGLNMNSGYDYEGCIGLKVKPRQGDGLLFYSVFINGTIDAKSLHGSCPVIKGEKWVATKWIRDQVQD